MSSLRFEDQVAGPRDGLNDVDDGTKHTFEDEINNFKRQLISRPSGYIQNLITHMWHKSMHRLD